MHGVLLRLQKKCNSRVNFAEINASWKVIIGHISTFLYQ